MVQLTKPRITRTPNKPKCASAVLVVDDNALTLMSAAMVVREAGFIVITAADADEAKRAMLLFSGFQALVTDIRMPGSMDGVALAMLARQLSQEVEILLVSGETQPPHSDLPERARFLPKPYSPADLARVLHELIG